MRYGINIQVHGCAIETQSDNDDVLFIVCLY